jgi:transcriptional regulator with GAF, ATPase, and Fis domain
LRPPACFEKAGELIPSESGLAELDCAHILRTLGQTGWRIRGMAGAAECLAINPTTLESRIKRLGLWRPFSAMS